MLTTDDIFHHLFQTLCALIKAGFARTAIDVNSDIIELLIGGGLLICKCNC
jgi:N-formylglutamate amidohydrolase